jgi:tRNA(Ile)-lysidine synthase TilS/MesJ
MALAGVHPHHRVAVGVSGGPDSMALCVLAAAWKKAGEGREQEDEGEGGVSGFVDGLLGVVVDHGLRPESADEAQLVRDRVRGMGVVCEIATCEWPNGRPKLGHIQEAAREMRCASPSAMVHYLSRIMLSEQFDFLQT